MAPVSTRGRTAGWPHTPPLHGLKPNVLDGFVLAADEGSLKIEAKKTLSTTFIYTGQKYLHNWCTVKKKKKTLQRIHFKRRSHISAFSL